VKESEEQTLNNKSSQTSKEAESRYFSLQRFITSFCFFGDSMECRDKKKNCPKSGNIL
jgi:hypothetical protein